MVIIGDVILNGVIQERLNRKERAVKVQNFQDETADDTKHHVIPLIQREASFVIIHAGTDDVPYFTSLDVLDNPRTFKSFITDNLPNCKVVISTPVLRTADGKAALTVSQLTNHRLQLDHRLQLNLLSSIKSF